ncbi:MAG: CHASE2 domain-containing protein, partial [bacterium]|nr:CHASE2 domain-containing protein [bacterium]
EIFRYDREHGRDEIVAFVNLLLGSVKQEEMPIYVVTTMRSEFIGKCALFYNLPEIMNQGQFLTSRLTRSQQRESIVGPAQVFQTSIEPRLVNKLLNEMSAAPEQFDQLPLLQHCLMRMWLNSGGQNGEHMTSADYDAIGGIRDALSNHADEAYDELEPEQQRLAEKMFRSLSERNPEGQDVRRPLPLKALAEEVGASETELTRIIETFHHSDRNFLSLSGRESGSGSVVDISHESLIRQWGELKGWVEEEAESAEAYLNLAKRARRWNEKKGELLRGLDLDTPLKWKQEEEPSPEWAQRYDPDFALSMKYLTAGERVRDKKLRRSVFGRQLLAPFFGLMLCLILAWWTSFFDFFLLDTRIQQLTISLGNELAAREVFPREAFRDDIILVPIREEAKNIYGDFGPEWRKYHAKLVDTLSQAGAKVLVFAMAFSRQNDAYDPKFIQAIQDAVKHGTAVVIGIRDLKDNEPAIAENFKSAVSGFGAACVDTKLGSAQSAPLAIAKNVDGEHYTSSLPSLALEAFLKYKNQDNYLLDLKEHQILTWKSQQYRTLQALDFSELRKKISKGCPVIQDEDRYVDLFIQFSQLEMLRDPSRRFPYEKVLNGDYKPERFRGKIVFIGLEDEFNVVQVARGIGREDRYGFEIFADALNTMLNEVTFRDLNIWAQLLLMLLLSWLGATIRYWLSSQKVWRRSLFFLVLLTYAAAAVYFTDQYHIFLDSVYHIGAYWASYWMTGKWFL